MDGENSMTVKLIGKGILALLTVCAKQATVDRELIGISSEDWEQRREAIMLEHSTKGAREQLSAESKSWLLSMDQKGWGCAAYITLCSAARHLGRLTIIDQPVNFPNPKC